MANSSNSSGSVDALARALRDAKATRFFAVVDDDKARELKTAKTRGRWERLVNSALALGATAIECRDEDGAVLEVVQLELEPQSDAASSTANTTTSSKPTNSAAEVERLLGLVLRAQDVALQRQGEQVTRVTEAALRVMESAANRASSMERAVLALVQRRERELEQTAEQLDAELAAMARADARAAAERAHDAETTSELDRMTEKLMSEAVTPVLQAKVLSVVSGMGKKAAS